MSENFFEKKVTAISPDADKKISQILSEMAKTGFQGRSLAEAAEVLEAMIMDKDTTILFGYAASLSTTGQWKIINWLIENHYIDILVSTGANISEDIVEAMGFSYYQCKPGVDDEKFFKEGLNRYYDLFGREDDYMKMTEMIAEFILTLDQKHKYSSREFLYLFGKWLHNKEIKSIVATAAEHNVPVFCPAIIDSPYGDAALIAKSKGFELVLDGVKDYIEFMRLSEKVNDTGVVYIGGGVPKDFIQLFAVTADLLYPDRKVPNRRSTQSRKGVEDETYYPHKYAVQITTDSPQWGSLSGCTFDEAVSWGKETKQGRYIQCYCDATIALPIISHALAERINVKREGKKFSLELKE
ncbi:deoxyhypusine synthase family protein [Candidatus Woesearchaeota archaeon]|nr:deoxyhypusine synthase family protein [Candidatus Woesearchaeota archaeon]